MLENQKWAPNFFLNYTGSPYNLEKDKISLTNSLSEAEKTICRDFPVTVVPIGGKEYKIYNCIALSGFDKGTLTARASELAKEKFGQKQVEEETKETKAKSAGKKTDQLELFMENPTEEQRALIDALKQNLPLLGEEETLRLYETAVHLYNDLEKEGSEEMPVNFEMLLRSMKKTFAERPSSKPTSQPMSSIMYALIRIFANYEDETLNDNERASVAKFFKYITDVLAEYRS